MYSIIIPSINVGINLDRLYESFKFIPTYIPIYIYAQNWPKEIVNKFKHYSNVKIINDLSYIFNNEDFLTPRMSSLNFGLTDVNELMLVIDDDFEFLPRSHEFILLACKLMTDSVGVVSLSKASTTLGECVFIYNKLITYCTDRGYIISKKAYKDSMEFLNSVPSEYRRYDDMLITSAPLLNNYSSLKVHSDDAPNHLVGKDKLISKYNYDIEYIEKFNNYILSIFRNKNIEKVDIDSNYIYCNIMNAYWYPLHNIT